MANNQKRGGPYLPNLEAFYQLGMDPKTGLPMKVASDDRLKDDIKRMLRVIDEQDSIGRYEWTGLPDEINPQLLERILYYRGQGMFFYIPEAEKYYFLPYALDGTIDVYARYTGVTPLPFNGGASADGKQKPWITGLVREPIYEPFKGETATAAGTKCVLIKDYTEQQPEQIISRQILNEGLLDMMANCIPYMNTALIKATGVGVIRVGNADEQSNVTAANRSFKRAALCGEPNIAAVGAIDWQSLCDGTVAKAEEFMQAMQSLDNFRLSSKGLTNGGLYEKKAHMLQDEQDMTNANASLVLQDGLNNRQRAADLINSVFPDLHIGVKIKEQEQSMNLAGEDTGDTINNEAEAQEAADE